jgi:hypothetical protein
MQRAVEVDEGGAERFGRSVRKPGKRRRDQVILSAKAP